MTKIKFQRTGGLLGHNIDIDLDLDTLPASEALNILQMLHRCNFFRLPEDLVAKSTPDEFQYTVQIESGTSRHSIRTSDTGAPESLRPLLNELSTIAMVSLVG